MVESIKRSAQPILNAFFCYIKLRPGAGPLVTLPTLKFEIIPCPSANFVHFNISINTRWRLEMKHMYILLVVTLTKSN